MVPLYSFSICGGGEVRGRKVVKLPLFCCTWDVPALYHFIAFLGFLDLEADSFPPFWFKQV